MFSEQTGEIVRIRSVSYGLGGVAGSFLSGYIAEASGIPAFFRIASALCIVSMILLFILSKTRRNVNIKLKGNF